MTRGLRHRRAGRIGAATLAGAIVALAVFGGTAASAQRATVEGRVVTLPIANGFPLDLGIKTSTPRYMSEHGCEVHVLPATATGSASSTPSRLCPPSCGKQRRSWSAGSG